MLRVEAMLYSSRNTSAEDAFTEKRTTKQLQDEIHDLISILDKMRAKNGPIPFKDLIIQMYNGP
jgi:hypothetical protein